MSKKFTRLTAASIGALMCCTMLTACPKKPDPTPEPPTPVVPEEEYVIQVTAPSAVTWSLDKTKAKKGEEVTLTISKVAAGVSIKSVTYNNKDLTGKDGVYKFTMPNRSVAVLITCSVEGDVVIEGDITAQLTPVSGQEGLFVARGVQATGLSSKSKFNWIISSGSEKTKCEVLDLDETKSFADICMITGSTSEYNFDISNGYTYDFYYDSNNSECPCYVQRTGYDKLPTNAKQLEALFIVGPAVRSEYAVYPDDLVGVHYEINDRSTDDVIQQQYDWSLYENGLSFAKVTSSSGFEDDEDMYVYKKYDSAKNTYQLVDTYPYKSGAKIINDDRYRPSDNNYGPISGTYNVIDEDDYGHRYDISRRSVERNVKTSAHMPNYYLERELMYAYRVGFQTDDGVSFNDIQITPSEKDSLGNGTVTLNSIKEYDSTKTGGASVTVRQEAYKYTVTVNVNARSEITAVNYKEVHFDAESWDFSSHDAKVGNKGTTLKTVKASYTYGSKATGTPNYGDFKLSDWFITSISNVQLWNGKIKDDESKNAGKSIVGINDTVSLYDSYTHDFNPLMLNKKYYAPATALDFWQYAPVASSNEAVIAHCANNAAYEMTALTEGSATLTINSHVAGQGPTIELPVQVTATSLVREFYMTQYEKNSPVEGAIYTTIKGGGTYRYYINPFPYDAALKYHPVSSNTSLLTVDSADNATVLVINASGAKNITSTQTVTVTLEAEYQWQDNAHTKRFSPTVLTFTIIPGDINPIGKWTHIDKTAFPNTYVTFTNEAYTGTVEAGMEGAKKATIHDDYYDNSGVLKSSDNYDFYYTYNDGQLKVVLYNIDMQYDPLNFGNNPKDFYLDFQYQSTTGHYLMYLGYIDEVDTEAGVTWYYSIIGGSDSGYDNSESLAYAPFERK